MCPTIVDALVVEVEQLHERRCRRATATSDAGHDRREPAQAEHERQREQPDGERRGTGCRRGGRGSRQSCSKKSPSPFSTPNSFGTWPIMIVSARPMMNPLSTGSEMKLARNPSRSRPASRARTPVVDRERGGERERRRSVRRGEVGDRGGRQRGGGRHRPDDQVARAAEGGVQQQRRRRRVQADDGRDAGDRRVGERLGHQHRPHREPGDQVAAQPRAVVAAQRREDRRVTVAADGTIGFTLPG